MLKSQLLLLLQQEIRRHDFNYFIEDPPSVAQGGNGVVVPGRVSGLPEANQYDAAVFGSPCERCAAEGHRRLAWSKLLYLEYRVILNFAVHKLQ
jgi:hypothetical protein